MQSSSDRQEADSEPLADKNAAGVDDDDDTGSVDINFGALGADLKHKRASQLQASKKGAQVCSTSSRHVPDTS